MLFNIFGDILASGKVEEFARQRSLVPFNPRIFAVVETGESGFDDFEGFGAFADGDDFTNLEEFKAGTDPTDKNDHPDYLDSLRIKLPLKETYMPFVFTGARKVADGWRCEFFDASQKDDYGRAGRTFSATINEEIGAAVKKPTGVVLKAYEKKECPIGCVIVTKATSSVSIPVII